jgi:outer membrane lipoprotein-sorting protein
MMRRTISHDLLVLILVLLGCFLPTSPFAQEGSTRAEELFYDLEEKLLHGTAWVVRAQTTSQGAFSSSLSGAVALRQGNIARIEINGSFGGNPVDAFLISDGAVLLYGDAHVGSFEDAVPWALNEALIIGMTRMGLLHNFALLTAGDPPDRAKGGVRDWVEVVDFSLGEIETVNQGPALPVSFGLIVSGQPAGQATLWFDEETGLPVQRRQTVDFDTGTMTVTEVYEFEDIPALQ